MNPHISLLPVSLLVLLAFAGCSEDAGEPATDPGAADAHTGAETAGDATATDAGEEADTTKTPVEPPAPFAERVTISSGELLGQVSEDIRIFRNIPYAAPPVAENRWRSPQPVAPWEGTREALEDGPACPQLKADSSKIDDDIDEDCLHLNVYTPAETPKAPLPVIVWIHGGAFVAGHKTVLGDEGSKLPEIDDVVVVAINYRLGVLGFLYDEAARAAADGEPPSGNFGLEDQLAALRWVRDEISAFGGDPSNVTVLGESAGAISICALLTAPKAEGLFHRAAMNSGACAGTRLPSLEEAEARTALVAKNASCPEGEGRLECLRNASVEELLLATKREDFPRGGVLFNGNASVLFWPVVDGEVLVGQPSERLLSGDFHKVPVLVGSNSEEGILFHLGLIGDRPVKSEEDYLEALGNAFGDDAEEVAAEYPAGDYKTPKAALVAVTGHAFFNCPAKRTAAVLAAADAPAFLYHFSQTPAGMLIPGLGATHGADLIFLFGVDAGYLGKAGEEGADLSAAMMKYWTQFARSGAPGAVNDLQWPDYGEDGAHMELVTPPSVGNDLFPFCDFWETLTTPWPRL